MRPDTSGFSKELDKNVTTAARHTEASLRSSNREFERFGRGALVGTGALGRLGRAAAFASTAFIGGAGLTYAIKQSVTAASNLAEQTSKTDVVFGKSAANVETWSKTTVNSLGLASDQALETASSFGALLTPLGIVGQAAADQSVKLTQLGADLASFYNTSVQDALTAIKSGLVGEVEPLRRYGVILSEARVQQEAFAETGKNSAASLTSQEKVLARQALIYKDTAQAQGDFARTSGGFANQQRILAANIRQLEIVLGQTLIPTLTNGIKHLNDWLGKQQNQKRIQDDVNGAVDKGRGLLEGLASAYAHVASAYGKLPDFGKHQGLLDILPKEGNKGLLEILHAPLANFTALGLIFREGKEPPADGWVPFFNAVASLAHLGNVAAKGNAVDAGVGPIGPLPSLVPSKVSGGAFLGFPVTAKQRRDEALALVAGTGSPAEVAAEQSIIDAADRAIAYARKHMHDVGANAKAYEDAIISYLQDRRGALDRIGQIAADNAAAAVTGREKRRQAILDAIGAGASGTANAGGALAALQGIVAGQVGGPFSGAGKVGAAILAPLLSPTAAQSEAALRIQIAEAGGATERALVKLNQALLAADQAHLAVLKKIGATEEAKLQEQLNIAQVKARIRDLQKKEQGQGGFTLSELFAEAASEANQFGSNIGGPGSLSPQGGRGNLGKTIVVNQHYYGDQPNPAQALMSAAQAAKSLRLG